MLSVLYLMQLASMIGVKNFDKIDILGRLPPEVASMILRLLDIDTLLTASVVSTYWKELCLSDPILRKRIAEHLKYLKSLQKENNKPSKVVEQVKSYDVTKKGVKRKRRNDNVKATKSRKVMRL